MPRSKTILTPEQQWESTIRYVQFLSRQYTQRRLRGIYEARQRENRPYSTEELSRILELKLELVAPVALPSSVLWVVNTPHPLLNVGDVLFVTWLNGMAERFGMTGVSSKGARLHDYFVPLRRRYNDEVELPGDLIDLRCDDPAIGRFVADLRASSRRRVGASIPAPTTLADPGQGAQGLRFDGCYRSRRGPRHQRLRHFHRNYLRFFPDGTVVAGYYAGFTARHREWFVGGEAHGMGKRGTYTIERDVLTVVIYGYDRELERYEGTIDGERLRLSRKCLPGWGESREDDVYKFGTWIE